MVFAPCQRLSIEPDGTVTLTGMFTQVTTAAAEGRASLDFTLVALLIGGLGDVAVRAQLVSPDGNVGWQGSTRVSFAHRRRLHAVQWRLDAAVVPGEYELQLVFDEGSPSVGLPFVVIRA